MKFVLQPPKKALKLFIRQKPLRSEIDIFKTNLIILLDKISVVEKQPKDESEEHLKNNIRDFLRDTYYKDTNAINTKDKKDLVIHVGNSTDTEVGVIIEAKRPSNKNEMISAHNPNKKALHELILYYLDERQNGNYLLKQLIVTNINEWFIIDANVFDKQIYRNPQIKKLYDTKLNHKKDNPWFYEEIAKIIDNLDIEITGTHFDIRKYENFLRNNDNKDDKELIALYKIFSPQHLLKIETFNDSNSLNEKFYKELLHIIGLEETKEGSINIIQRKEKNRNQASLIELTIDSIKTEEILHRISDSYVFGENHDEQSFNIAFELCISWINRILFLKLLEAQLISYHQGNKDYRFLNIETIKDFDELFKLFHKVLAVKIEERAESIRSKYCRVPYLNSSLFEISELEDQTIKVNSLENGTQLELYNFTVLKEIRKKTDKLSTLEYLFNFLDAYDFASEGIEDVQEDNKSLINASVLGKVFEKINGYKDGSIFTPAFITGFMCRESIRKAVVQKFNEYCIKNDLHYYSINRIEDVYELIPQKISRKKANEIVNSLKICDPAVGSGHFLVSALNELIVIKNDLKIIYDKNDKSLHHYEIEIVNDELVVTDIDGELYNYNPKNKESQRIQETLFHEKQTIIENCLFGVDINPKSVLICRLRLWIELLKNAYYIQHSSSFHEERFRDLQTLPNIDINIKCGNSLISRFDINADISKALKSVKYDIETYRSFVSNYKNENNREVKRGLQKIIDSIKLNFRTEIYNNDTKVIRLNKVSGELYNLFNQTSLFEEDENQREIRKLKQAKLEKEITELTQQIDEIKNNILYKNAFEWRFEFPEVLDDSGNFIGFDLVIANPPYIQLQKESGKLANMFENQNYITLERTGDIYTLFYEKGNQIIKNNAYLAFITSNKWLRAAYGKQLRNYFLTFTQPELLVDLGSGVFDEATVDSSILICKKQTYQNQFLALDLSKEKNINNLYDFKNKMLNINPKIDETWNIISELEQNIKRKIETLGKPLKDWNVNIYRGILTGFNEAFIIDGKKKDELIAEDPRSAEIIKPILRGRDIKRYKTEFADLWLINIPKGFTIKSKNEFFKNRVEEPMPRYGYYEYDEAWQWFKHELPAIANYLKPFAEKAKIRKDMGDYWWELRACSYLNEFEKEKIVWNRIASEKSFTIVKKGFFIQDSMHFIVGNNLKYICGILNSSLYKWIMNIIVGTSVGGNAGNSNNVKGLNLPLINDSHQQPFIKLVDKIIELKEIGADTKEIEKQIDNMVYELYDLSNEEIAFIENTQTDNL